MEIKIGSSAIGDGHPCFIVAEAGINHNGEFEKAKMLVDAAAEGGADAIKFQTHLTEKEMLPDAPTAGYVGESLFTLLKRLELSREEHVELKKYAEKKGLIFLSTPFSKEAADLLEELEVEAYKTGSGELTNLPLLEHIARKRKPMLVSTGMSTLEEIGESVDLLKKLKTRFVLMHCTSSYPTKYEDLNLRVINKLREKFGVPIGISDHSVGIYTVLAAVVLGACVIEKHFTIDRNWPGPDQKASINPQELGELVRGTRAIEKALGDVKRVTSEEAEIQRMAR
ncbi:MAG: N-acetylneuraminate synthase family protein, partial [Chloroflexi bacterium]|nr:N-acetylneuraminate synthase family protein [Chloroflexota bacterium]